MIIRHILLSAFLVGCAANNVTRTEEQPSDQDIFSSEIELEIQAPNQTTILTNDTKIYGIPLKDKDEKHIRRNYRKEGIRGNKFFNTPVVRFRKSYIRLFASPATLHLLEDTASNYPTVYNEKLNQELQENIAKGTALLCNNIPLSPRLQWDASSYGIVVDSTDPSDCDRLREL